MRQLGTESKYVSFEPFQIKVGAVACIDWVDCNSANKQGGSKFALTESTLTQYWRIS